MNKSGLYAYEDRDMHTVVKCVKCHKILFQGCSLGLTVPDKKECPYCKSPINVNEKWEAR